ncbi:AMP-binding protein [Myxococcota bacterium]|nr:AMP-binding protein [Myxococcota bacterium]
MDVTESAAVGLRKPEHRLPLPGQGPQSMAEVLDRVLAEDAKRPALVGRSGRYDYAQLDEIANRAAHALLRLGIKPGDRVAACLPNDVEIVVAMLACMRLGVLWVGVNRPLAPREKAYILRDSGARVLLARPEIVAELEPERSELRDLEHVIPSAPGSSDDLWSRLLEEAPEQTRPRQEIDPFGPAAIAYTSGTTGHPKGAVHSQHNMLLPGALAVATGRYEGRSQGMVLPLTILNLMVLGPATAWQDGACCVAIDRIDPEGLAQWIREERIGNVCGVPTILHDLLTHPSVTRDDLASLVTPEVGGAVVPEEFRRLYRERFGQGVRIGYGMTEAPTAVTWSGTEDSPLPGLCGRPQPYVEILILDEQGHTCPTDEVGEICVAPASRGEWKNVYTPMLGYWGHPEATREALVGGVYHTGDLGFLAEDGNLFIRGRRNELILRGGANVYPAEVERVLELAPEVAGSAVLGVPDDRLGERVVAAVELEPGATVSIEPLLARCRQELARYKVPSEMVIVEELPRNAMSKVVKRELLPLFEGD